jgi:hypothetical protein
MTLNMAHHKAIEYHILTINFNFLPDSKTLPVTLLIRIETLSPTHGFHDSSARNHLNDTTEGEIALRRQVSGNHIQTIFELREFSLLEHQIVF